MNLIELYDMIIDIGTFHDFLLEREIDRNWEPKTFKAYQYEFVRFFEWWDWHDIRYLSVKTIINYRKAMRQKTPHPWKINTIRRTSSVLRTFIEYLRDKEIVPDDRTTDPKRIKHPPRDESAPSHACTPAELKRVLNNCKRNTDIREDRYRRDELMLHLMLYTGVRVSELPTLTLDHIKDPIRSIPGYRYLRVKGKGGKWRFTVIPEFVVAMVEEYCQDFMIDRRRPIILLSERYIRLRLQRLSKGLIHGVPHRDWLDPHDCRRGFACWAYYRVSDKDILRVQEWLGHADLDTTYTYVRHCTRLIEAFVRSKK